MDLFRYDFGYEWPWTWGHVIGAVVFALAAYTAWRVARPRVALVFAALGAWAVAGAAIVNLVLGFSLSPCPRGSWTGRPEAAPGWRSRRHP